MLGTDKDKVGGPERLVEEQERIRRRQETGTGRVGRVWAGVCLLAVVSMIAAVGCESDAGGGAVESGGDVETSGVCQALEERLGELRDERESLRSRRKEARRRLDDLEEAVEQLEAFEPELKATTVHIYPKPGAKPREISGQIRNDTDETVAVMHLEATLIAPEAENGESIERDVAYELREPLAGGEVQHAPYGEQLVEAFPDVASEAWIEGELQLEVMALEGPDGDVLWDRRGRDVDSIERGLEELEAELDTVDERIAGVESQLSGRRSSGVCGE